MKGKVNVSKTARRKWRNNSGVCNHHSGCGGFCRSLAEYSPIGRGKTNVARSNSLCDQCSASQITCECGSVTAEFALVIPAVLLVLILAMTALSLQSQRTALVEIAASGARELARGETTTTLDELLAESKLQPTISIEHRNHLVCLELRVQARLSWLGAIPVSETQCARKSGL